MRILLLTILLIVLYPLHISAQVGSIILEDHFNGNTLDNSKWQTIYSWGPVLNKDALEFFLTKM